jgi:dihydroflavonol-4-reductase
MAGESVLVTGGSGFIGVYCILHLLSAGYVVRTTVRSRDRESEVRAMLKAGGAEPGEAISFTAADLRSDAGWREAVAGCSFVLHVASPFPTAAPKRDDELVVPAREGTLRVLRAARDASVHRVVLTSSFAAIGYGHKDADRPFTEESWTELNGGPISAYVKSKTLAERAAWDFVAKEGGPMELAAVNPVGVVGPVLGPDFSHSIQIVKRLLEGAPGLPRASFGIVDVRDVADLHLRAMTHPAAKGERFLAISGDFMTLLEVAQVLRARMGDAASQVTTQLLPDWLLRATALFSPSVAMVLPDLGTPKNATSEKAMRVLGWAPRSREDAIVATAESLMQFGLLRAPKKAA